MAAKVLERVRAAVGLLPAPDPLRRRVPAPRPLASVVVGVVERSEHGRRDAGRRPGRAGRGARRPSAAATSGPPATRM